MCRRIDKAHPQTPDVDDHFAADAARRRGIVRAVDFDVTVEVNGSLEDAVVLEPCCRQRQQMRPFLFEHRPHLPFGRAVNARRRPALVPVCEKGVLLVDALEAPPLQSRFLRVSDCRFNFALEIGRVWPARQRDNAVAFEHLGIERVELWIVDVGLDDTLFEVVEPDRRRRAAEIRERLLVQSAPDLTRRFPNGLAEGVATVAQRHHEQPRPTIFAGARVTRQRAFSIVNLRLLARLGFKPATDLRFICA